MDVVRFVMVIVLAIVVAPPESPAADVARCQSVILGRGTTLFEAVTDITARCVRKQLRTADLSGNCPNERDAAQIDALTATAVTAIDTACGPNSQTATCIDYGNIETFDLVSGVFRIATTAPRGPTLRCLDTIGRQAVRLAELRARQLESCNDNLLRSVAGYGPAGPTCDGPSGTQATIAAAETRLVSKLSRVCGGPDRTAGTADDLDPQSDLGFGTICPGLPYCTAGIDTLPDLIGCVSCLAREEVAQVSRGFAALPLDAATTCDAGTGSAFLILLESDLRDLAACESRTLDGRGSGICPDAETMDDLSANEGRYSAHVAAVCGGVVDPPSFLPLFLAFSLNDALYPAHAEEPDRGRLRCKDEIGRSATSSVGYARRKSRTLRTCNMQRLCGQTSAPCPDSEASAAIATSAAKATSDIHNDCDAYTPSLLGYGPTCPSSGACGALPTTTISELITCLQCVADEVVDAAAALVF